MNDPEFQRRLRETFRVEAAEHLQAMAQEAFALERGAPASEHAARVERIFRETHTLKGAARMVGENVAEALCHALEQQLSTFKQQGASLSPALVDELGRRIAAIGRALSLTPSTPVGEPPVTPERGEAAPASGAAVASSGTGQIRVSSARLDALLTRTEELVSAKLTGSVRVAALRELRERGTGWKKEWEGVRSDFATLRRFLDSGAHSPVEGELRALLHFAETAHEFARHWQRDVTRLATAAHSDHRKLSVMVDQLLEETKEVLMQPFSSLLESFPAFVREIAQQHGKDIEFQTTGGETEIDRRVLEEMKDVLMHLVRNAVDHGIESVADRRSAGKPERARLLVAVEERSGGNVEIVVRDDGRGIDAAAIVASARRLNLIASDAEPSEQEALALIFASGFSTRIAATALSGRGLGLAIVREKVEQLGGSVNVESAPGRGTVFRLLLPVAFARFRGVFVQAGGQTFVIPSSYVLRILRVREADLRQVKNQLLVDVDGHKHVVLALPELLGLSRSPKRGDKESERVFLVLLQSGNLRVAVRVEGVPYEEQIVMKNLGKLLRRGRRYVGATLMGGEQIVPVLNVADLLGATVRRGSRRAAPSSNTAPAETRRRTILVAEDSITSRSLLKNILQTAGFEVRTAVDGADALTTLKFESVDLLISDVQMPRLDGFELTARVRADAKLSTLPVILITSLASQEDKARGVDAGANAYLVKSSFDQSDLLAAIGRLLP